MKKIISILLVIIIAFGFAACSNNNDAAKNLAATEDITVDTSGMTKEEVSILSHVYFDMYEQRANFFGAGKDKLEALSKDIIDYLNTQKVENEIIAGYINDFKNVYVNVIEFSKDQENKEKKKLVEESIKKATMNVPSIRAICDEFDVPWVYFQQEYIQKDGVYFVFSNIKRREVLDEQERPTGKEFIFIQVSAQNRTSRGVYGKDLINFDLYDPQGNVYELKENHIRQKTVLDNVIETSKKAKAIISFEVPKNLNFYILVQDTSNWSKEGNRFLRIANYTLF
ncbi:MAG: DUF4352 domain-containing protein [Bacillota bacterium]